MIDIIAGEFPLLRENCLESDNEETLYVADPGHELPCTLVENEDGNDCVVVHNPHLHSVFLISVDNCLTKNMGIKSCDCVLVGFNKLIFLELKLNVTTARLKNADDTREGALFQISRTTDLFGSALLKILENNPNAEIIAQVAMPPVAPRSNATYNLMRSAFGEKYGYDYVDSHQVVIT